MRDDIEYDLERGPSRHGVRRVLLPDNRLFVSLGNFDLMKMCSGHSLKRSRSPDQKNARGMFFTITYQRVEVVTELNGFS